MLMVVVALMTIIMIDMIDINHKITCC
jgi:hypothetical protein